MYNELNINFLQIQNEFLKILARVKMYLPWRKWTMNESLIFFKIPDEFFKNYRDKSYIYHDGNEQWMNR